MFKLLNHKFKITIPEINIQIPAVSLLFFVLAAYTIWEAYWYQKVELRFIKWHTHLAPFLYLWLIGYFIFSLLRVKESDIKKQNAFLLFTSILFSLMIAEAFMITTGMRKTYMERISGAYYSPYSPQDKTHYHIWPNNQEHWITKPEYAFRRPTNSQGLPDREWFIDKKPGEKKILALGDSFTEGDGAPDDSDYVALLTEKLATTGYKYYLMNAGVCGSDPFFNYVQLKDRLLTYSPDYIFQTLSSGDVMWDILQRGGMERFKADGSLQFAKAPWWEPLYAVSNVSRIFFELAGYNEMLQRINLPAKDKARLNNQVIALFKEYNALCIKKSIKLFIILRPDRREIERNQYDYDFSEILKNTDAEIIDLLPLYRAYIRNNKTSATDYFWKIDGHHNSKGYQMMADVLFDSLAPELKDSLPVAASKIEAGLKTKQATNFSKK